MSEATMPTREGRRSSPWVTALLLGALVVLFVGAMLLAPRGDAPEGEAFGGTDAKVTEVLKEGGTEPWFTPIFRPGSGEIESGLFALQAGLGGAVLGYALGRLRSRK